MVETEVLRVVVRAALRVVGVTFNLARTCSQQLHGSSFAKEKCPACGDGDSTYGAEAFRKVRCTIGRNKRQAVMCAPKLTRVVAENAGVAM